MSSGVETLHDGIVRFNAVLVLAGFERGVQNGVGIAMIRYHNVLVAATGPDGKSATVIGV